VVRPCHKRAGLGLISALTNKGELRWMVLDGALKAPSLIRFLGRLIQETKRIRSGDSTRATTASGQPSRVCSMRQTRRFPSQAVPSSTAEV
jgi:hypothetical protein